MSEQGAAGAVEAAKAQQMDRVAPLTPNAWLRYDLIRRMIPPTVHDVLEIGCGVGALGVRLSWQYRYLGLEPSAESFAVADQRMAAGGRGEIRNALTDALDPAERFDLVCAFEVLEHIEDDAGALASWAQRVRPGGWLLLSVPAHQKRFSAADQLVGHFRRYEPEGLTALLEKTGFEQVKVREYGMPLGYCLEAGRNLVGRRRLAAAPQASKAELTGASARLLQPRGALYGSVARYGTAPFRYVQRGFPHRGTGLVARAKLPEA
jgi:SAM-dependent methyltransferase